MRNLKYKIVLIELIFIICGFVIWINLENKLIGFFTLLLFVLITNGAWYLYIKQQIKKKNLVHIKHPKDPGLNLAFVLLGLLLLLIFLYILFNDKATFTDPLLTPLYIGLVNGVFNFSNGFFIDKYGIIQPETFKRNLTWVELPGFQIEKVKISFKLKDSLHSFEISSENEKTIRDLISRD